MKRLLMILVSALLVTGINGCGSPDTKSGTSAVTINLGETKTASPSGKILGASSIPTTVASVRFTISAPDMATIERIVSVEGRTSISESFDVPNGANRYFLVEVMDASGNVLYRGDTYANLDGAIVTITIAMTPTTWAKTYGGTGVDYANFIQRTSDGGYIVVGETQSFGAGSENSWVLKLDSNGIPQWQKTYGGTVGDAAGEIQQTTDGGYIVAGETWSFGAGAGDLWVLKLDSSGNPLWQKAYGTASDEDEYSIQQTSDGGYIVVSSVNRTFGDDAWILKLNSSGGIVWQKTYGRDLLTGDNDYVYSIQQTSDGGYIVAGETGSFGSGNGDLWVLKLASDGTVQWQKTFGGTGVDYAESIQQTSDGGYIVAGRTDSFGAGGLDFWALKLASDGTIQWQKTYGGTGTEYHESIQQTSDGGYIVAGEFDSFGSGNGDLWVLKLNSDGSAAWQKTYGGTGFDSAESIQQTSDGGYIVAGETSSFGAGGGDFWILKLAEDGTISFNPTSGATITDTNATITNTSVTGANTSATVTDTSATITDTSATVTDTNATITQQAP